MGERTGDPNQPSDGPLPTSLTSLGIVPTAGTPTTTPPASPTARRLGAQPHPESGDLSRSSGERAAAAGDRGV